MFLVFDGVLAGTAHVLTGPDHLAGVAPLAADGSRRVSAAAVGASWGLGHGLGVALLGTLGQFALDALAIERTSLWAERLVGVMLIGLGAAAMHRARRLVANGQVHGQVHAHAHGQATRAHSHQHAALGVGVVHGLAGAGHFWAVLPSLALPAGGAATYIAGYLFATVAAMTAFGAALGWLGRRFGVGWVVRFQALVGGLTILVGVAWTALAFDLV